MKEVTRDEFYKHIYDNNLDVNPCIVNGRWPFTSELVMRDGRTVIGESVGYLPEGKNWPEETRYYLKGAR